MQLEWAINCKQAWLSHRLYFDAGNPYIYPNLLPLGSDGSVVAMGSVELMKSSNAELSAVFRVGRSLLLKILTKVGCFSLYGAMANQ